MLYIAASIILVLAFFVPILAYRMGIKEGYEMAKGITPKPIKPATEIFKSFVKEDKVPDKVIEGWNNLMNYDGNPQGGEE